jgi:hypothetical protein
MLFKMPIFPLFSQNQMFISDFPPTEYTHAMATDLFNTQLTVSHMKNNKDGQHMMIVRRHPGLLKSMICKTGPAPGK